MATWLPTAGYFVNLSALIRAPAHWRALADGDDPWRKEVDEFVGKLKLLHGVPFKYLVPDSRMLPQESIRFFYVDPNWIGALADGALSIGRLAEIDHQHDSAVAADVHEAGDRVALDIRRRLLDKDPAPPGPLRPLYTGFLLRSAVVSGWPGLEVAAYRDKDGTSAIDPLRIARLASDVMIGLFPDRIQRLNLHEPKEGITFGAEPKFADGSAEPEHATADPVSYTKQLRGLGFNNYKAGDLIPNCDVPVPLRPNAERVVLMADLKAVMVARLTGLTPPAWDKDRPFTSAQFTLQMVQGASQHNFDSQDAGPPPERRRWSAPTSAADTQRLQSFLFGS